MSNKNPLDGRGRAEEERWAREQDRIAIEKMKQKDKEKGAGTTNGDGTGDKSGGEKKGCSCKTPGDQKVAGKGCPCGRCSA